MQRRGSGGESGHGLERASSQAGRGASGHRWCGEEARGGPVEGRMGAPCNT
ncbi:hypothetical protein BC834DRAFT_880745, partial [Gloeopeniophorella convolvens]